MEELLKKIKEQLKDIPKTGKLIIVIAVVIIAISIASEVF